VAEEEVRLDSSMDGDLEAALARLSARLDDVEGDLEAAGRAGRRAGEGIDAGMGKATRATDRAGGAARRAAPPIREAGQEMGKAGARGAAASVGVDRFANKMQKAHRAAGGLGGILSIYKWTAIATGLYALAGGISALGAGAAIALGGLAPMVGTLAALPTLLVLMKLSLLAVKLAAAQLEQPLTRIKNQFTELGPVIAAGGLRSGMNAFANSIGGLAKATGTGLAGLGGEIGLAARNAGQLAASAPFLDRVRAIFAGLRPILALILAGLLSLGRVLINVIQGSLPMVLSMATLFRDAADGLQSWTAQTLANGRMAAWFTTAWDTLRRVVGVIVDVLIGLFNVFRIGAGYASDMGLSIEALAYKFRLWTASAEGQTRINRYFQDSLPALHEMGHLIGIVLSAFARVGSNQNIAPLLAQINNELLPALGRLVSSWAGADGLGPAIIHAATALADFLSTASASPLIVFAEAIAAIARGLIWVQQNVPGASAVMSTLLTTWLSFKLLGPVFSMVAGGAKAFSWISTASKMTGELSFMQKMMGGVLLPTLRMAARGFGQLAMAGVRALITLSVALFTTPIGWIILGIAAIIIAIILLWTKCAWFRDMVRAIWRAILAAFHAVVDALVVAWNATVQALQVAIDAFVGFFVGLWRGGVAVVSAIWHALVVAWQAVWSALEPIVRVIFNIIRVIIQIHVFVIMALIALIAWIAEIIFKRIVAIAIWAWQTGIRPVFELVAAIATWAWGIVSGIAKWAWNLIVGIVTWAWGIIQSIFGFLAMIGAATWTGISTAAQFAFNLIMTGINWLWTTILQPIFGFIGWVGSTLWAGISLKASEAWEVIKLVWGAITGWFSEKFAAVGSVISSIWSGISDAAGVAAELVKGAWNTVVDVLKGVWNLIAKVWNGIPSVQVPDWVPLVGGKTFSLPKMPELYAGGPAPRGPALVGERGPEPVVRDGRMVGMVGLGGPQVVNLPRGSYVVPNLNTMLAGAAKPLPYPVATAMAKASPDYATAGAGRDAALAAAMRELAGAVRSDRPMVVHGGEDTRKAVLTALRDHDREQKARDDYDYRAGGG